LNYKQY